MGLKKKAGSARPRRIRICLPETDRQKTGRGQRPGTRGGCVTGFKYCYGPVGSWRLGVSLGIDPVSRPEKVCDFDCVYCQLGPRAPAPPVRAEYVLPGELAGELERMEAKADYMTFSGRGEPTLAANIAGLLSECRRLRSEKTAIITNAALMHLEKIRNELSDFDLVIAKLDAPGENLLREINRPAPGVRFDNIVKGLLLFSNGRRGRLALQTMLIGRNRAHARELAALYARIKPDEVQLNTPLRPCAEEPLTRGEMALACAGIKEELKRLGAEGIKVADVYAGQPPHVEPVSGPATLKRRGKI